MRTISIYSLLYLFIVTIINTIVLVFSIVGDSKYPYYYLTLWAYYANSIYLIVVLICDISSFFFNSEKLDAVNSFMRDFYSKYSYSLSYTVTFLFWLLVILGEQFIKWDSSPIKVFFQIYLHGVVSLILIFEIIQSDRSKKTEWSYKDILILSIIVIVYSITILLGKYYDHFIPYQFMKYASLRQLITPLILIEVFSFNSYQLHLFFLKIKINYLTGEHEYIVSSDIPRVNKPLIPAK